MTTFSRTWDSGYEDTPDDTDQASLYALQMRYVREDIRERLEVDHLWNDGIRDGVHKKLTLKPFGSDPSWETAGEGGLYVKTIDTRSELFWKDSDSNILQITYEGQVKAVKTGAGTPVANVAGEFVGQRYFDTTDIGWWTCTLIGAIGVATWAADIPPQTIWQYQGSTTPPVGWLLCDGTSSTPDLSGRFIVGYDSADADYDAIAKVGGEKEHTLITSEIPAHTHTVITGSSAYGTLLTHDRQADGSNPATGSTGGDAAHENRPPFYTLAYIIKKPVA